MTKPKKKVDPNPIQYDFPDPYVEDDEFGCDVVTYLHRAAVAERWAERARSCGREDLAVLYENAAEYWYRYYKGMERE